MSLKTITVIAFIFCFSFIACRILFVPLAENVKFRDAIHGDSYSDVHTFSAALFFKDFGFTHSSFLPVFNYTGNGDTSNIGFAYTHYPALPDILAGGYAKILNTKNSKRLRLFPALLSVAFFFFIFYSLKIFLPDQRAAFLSAIVIVCSNYFIFWGDNLHKHLYEELLKWLYVFFLYQYFEGERKSKPMLAMLAIIFILISNISYEPVVYLSIVTVGFVWIYTKKFFVYENFLLLLMPVIGFAIHMYQDYRYLGSWDWVLSDMKDAFGKRTLGITITDNELNRPINFMDYVRIPYVLINRVERFFIFPGYALVVFSILALGRMKKESLKHFRISMILLLATLSWSVAMTQHFTVHAFTGKHIGLFYAFVIGYGLIEYSKLLKKHWEEKKILYQSLHVVFILYCCLMFITQQLIDIFRYGFLYPFLS